MLNFVLSLQRLRFDFVAQEGYSKKWTRVFKTAPLQNASATYVALKNVALGQGTERYAFQLYEAAKGGGILGKPMIAKLNLYSDGNANQNKYMRTYMFAQQLTRKLADEFNSKLDRHQKVSRRTPRISVLDCSIYILGQISFLVEPRLDHTQWEKWNSNNGVSSRVATVALPLIDCLTFSPFYVF